MDYGLMNGKKKSRINFQSEEKFGTTSGCHEFQFVKHLPRRRCIFNTWTIRINYKNDETFGTSLGYHKLYFPTKLPRGRCIFKTWTTRINFKPVQTGLASPRGGGYSLIVTSSSFESDRLGSAAIEQLKGYPWFTDSFPS